MTWGIFHFVSRGVGIEVWNGISAMIFSVLSGEIYLKLNRRWLHSYQFLLLWAICYKSEYKEALWIIQVEKHMEKAKK